MVIKLTTWQSVKVGELGRIVTGKTPKTAISENYGGDIPFLTPSDDMSVKYVNDTAKMLTERGVAEVKNALIPSDSVCVSCIGSDLGKVVITTEKTVTNQQINSIIVNKKLFDVSFIYYAMMILGKKLNFISKTSTAVPIVNKSAFSSYEIQCPSLEQQKEIAAILSALDSKIEYNQKINDNLQQQAAALFANFYDQAETEVGFTEMIQILGGGTPKTGESSYWNGDIPFFTPKDVGFPYTLTTEKTITEEGLAHCNSRLYPINTVFVTARGTVGKVGLPGVPMAMNQSCYALVGKDTHQLLVYFYTLKAVDRLKHKASGAVFDAITTRDFEAENIMKLSDDDTKAFLDVAEPIYQAVLNNSIENLRLSELRDSLLPKLMNGEIDVTDIRL